jgi:hypothetical protein
MEDVERRGVLMVVMGMESAGLALYSRWSERSGRDDVNKREQRDKVTVERAATLKAHEEREKAQEAAESDG